MKNIYKYILVITLMTFGIIENVNAGSTGENKCVGNGQCFLLCSYNDGASDYNIYYYPVDRVLKFSFGNNKSVDLNTDFSGKAFIDIEAQNELREGTCPLYVYIDDDEDVPCFDNDGTYCKTTEKFDEYGFELTATSKNNIKKDNAKERDNSIMQNSCVKDDTCMVACSYEHGFGDYAYIYISKDGSNKLLTSFTWSGNMKKTYQLGVDSKNNKAFVLKSDIIPKLREGICPQKVYMDVDYEHEICFEFENSDYCTNNSVINGHFDSSEILNNTKVKSNKKNEIQKYLVQNLECAEALEEIKKIEDVESNKIYEICSYNKESNDATDIDQIFVVNYSNKYDVFRYSKNDFGSYEMKKSDIESQLKYNISCTEYGEIYLNDVTTKSYINGPTGGCEETSSTNHKYFSNTKAKNLAGFGCSSSTTNSYIHYNSPRLCKTAKDETTGETVIIDSCNDLLGDALISEINSYLLYIKIAVPIIIIVMGSIDFGSAFIASDEEKMKKAQKKFIMRLIIGMVIFFIPSIINAVLNIANDVWGGVFGGSCDVGF